MGWGQNCAKCGVKDTQNLNDAELVKLLKRDKIAYVEELATQIRNDFNLAMRTPVARVSRLK